jgi:hypothetical protein
MPDSHGTSSEMQQPTSQARKETLPLIPRTMPAGVDSLPDVIGVGSDVGDRNGEDIYCAVESSSTIDP